MGAVAVQNAGPNYMHLPKGEERGYDIKWYDGLLSEVKEIHGVSVRWVKLPGHERNEALDCRNYARAAYKALNPDFDIIEEKLKGVQKPKPKKTAAQRPKKTNKFSRMLEV